MLTTSLDDLLSMAIFARVVERKSFTGAATVLGLSKSVVSARLAALEERLGVRLLHRSTRRLTLTEDGSRLYESCERILTATEEAAAAMHGVSRVPEGLLRVSAPVSFGIVKIAPLLGEFTERCPQVRLDLSLSDSLVDVVSGGFDVVVRFARQLDEARVARKIGSYRRMVYASPGYLARRGTPQVPDDLAKHNCILLSGQSVEWAFESGSETLTVPVSGNLVVDNVVVLRQALVDGLGLAMLPHFVVAADLAAGRLQRVLEGHVGQEISIFAVFPHHRHQPAKVRAFVELLVERLRSEPGAAAAPGSARRSEPRPGGARRSR
ncbi:LysR family transcriptional regulator [Sorangium sp. So ce1153]|uniref:LysR family transcriptional regulator n=1 Tax=Sorangium sp. So ce1153 TaxID=3133333 RepID=UPI003F640731